MRAAPAAKKKATSPPPPRKKSQKNNFTSVKRVRVPAAGRNSGARIPDKSRTRGPGTGWSNKDKIYQAMPVPAGYLYFRGLRSCV